MPRIHFLDDHLISQIAAGEVVERPASVVKELVENALDAGSTKVRVELEAGGKRRILVEDDGRGMDRDDALLAFDRHATSKINSFEDLERVGSLGFRGEALASIAAVSRLELRTAEEPGDGTLVYIEGGRVRRAEPVAHPRGSRFTVSSLFFNVPARRKFLKQPATELRRTLEVVQGYALAHPELGFEVLHEGRQVLQATAAGEGASALRQRIAQVFGAKLGEELVAIPTRAERPGERIHGFLGGPETARTRRSFVWVNSRLIRDRAVMGTFYRAARDEWKGENYPALFLFLELPPEEVDVNVHPQKSEVRFRDSSFLGRVSDALRAALAAARGEEEAPLRPPVGPPMAAAAWEGLGSIKRRDRLPPQDDRWERRPLPAGPGEPTGAGELVSTGESHPPDPHSQPGVIAEAPGEYLAGEQRIAQPSYAPMLPRTVPLSGRSGKVRPFRILGQYKGSLILLEGPDGLYLVDQHVAHERILYERLQRSLALEKVGSQRLLTPVILELSAAEALRLEELASILEGCGFGVTALSGQSVALTAVPSALSIEEAEKVVLELASRRGEAEPELESVKQELLDSLAASLSCKAAVKIHHPMAPEAMEAMISELFEAEQPYSCPHGRPVVLQMSDSELERRFGRR